MNDTSKQYPMIKVEDGIEWIYTEPTFRMGPTEHTVRDGEQYQLRYCASFEGSRWEGFVSIKKVQDGK